MSTGPARGAVVVGVDGSPGSDRAVDWASDHAAREHLPLTLVHGADPVAFAGGGLYPVSGIDYGRMLEEIRFEDAAMLSRASARSQARDGTVEVHVLLGDADPRSMLLQLAGEAAMIVVGSRGRGPVTSLLLGSVGAAVATHATCPVVVVRPDGGARPTDGVLVGADGTPDSLPAVELAFRIASQRSCPLTVLHCYRHAVPGVGSGTPGCTGDEAAVQETVARVASRFPAVEVRTRSALGHAAAELVSASGGFDLVVVGHHRRSLLDGLVHGSVARTVLEHATGPVAVVPAA